MANADAIRIRRAVHILAAVVVWGIGSSLAAPFASADVPDSPDELFFYRGDDGLWGYYEVSPEGVIVPVRRPIGGPFLAEDWSSITSVDLDGDGQDEMFFYRDDGLFQYYDVSSVGSLGLSILTGDAYTSGWSSITAVDLDGDGQDEMFFYRDDGLFRYYDIDPNGGLGSPILEGDGYTSGWSSITAVNLDCDPPDEMFFYRDDGLFRYYSIAANGAISTPILAGDGYSAGWSSITAMNGRTMSRYGCP